MPKRSNGEDKNDRGEFDRVRWPKTPNVRLASPDGWATAMQVRDPSSPVHADWRSNRHDRCNRTRLDRRAPRSGSTLTTIAADESRHAELSWARFVCKRRLDRAGHATE